MISLPEDVALTLLRGLGAYIRSAPTSDLPAAVRRFKGFRAEALARHREVVLGILDHEPTRTLILQWLDEDKPSLQKDAAEVLRTAAAREDGWEEALTGRSQADAAAAKPSKDPASILEASLRKEKAKLAKLREELKQARSDAERTTAEENSARTRAEQAEAALRAELDKLRERAEKAEADLHRTQERADRELRRARRDAERAEARLEELRVQLKNERARAPSAENLPESGTEPPPRKKRTGKKPRSGPRRPLRAPKGMLAEDPSTLERWLDRDDVHLLVDGYNVTKAEAGFGDLDLQTQRDRLVVEVNNLALRKHVSATVVFDGASVVRPRSKRKAVRVVFTDEGEIADDRIVEILKDLPPHPVVVATNDRELQKRAGELGATIATSDQLLAVLG